MTNNKNLQIVQNVASDPTAIGQFGLAMVTLVAASVKFGWTNGLGFLIPVAFILGGINQIYAGITDAKLNKSFGATVFFAYGVFWITMALGWMVKAGVFGDTLANQVDIKQFGFFFIGYLIFSLFATVASLETTKQLFFIFVFIDLLLLALSLNSFGIAPHFTHQLGAWSELFVSILGFYGAGGHLINNHLGFTLIPMGGPTGILKKFDNR